MRLEWSGLSITNDDAALFEGEKRSQFIREAVERELKRRERKG